MSSQQSRSSGGRGSSGNSSSRSKPQQRRKNRNNRGRGRGGGRGSGSNSNSRGGGRGRSSSSGKQPHKGRGGGQRGSGRRGAPSYNTRWQRDAEERRGSRGGEETADADAGGSEGAPAGGDGGGTSHHQTHRKTQLVFKKDPQLKAKRDVEKKKLEAQKQAAQMQAEAEADAATTTEAEADATASTAESTQEASTVDSSATSASPGKKRATLKKSRIKKKEDIAKGWVPPKRAEKPVLEALSLSSTSPSASADAAAAAAAAEETKQAAEAEAKAKAPTTGGGWWTKKATVRVADQDFRALHEDKKHFTTASEQQALANKLSREEKERRLFNDNSQAKGINFDKYNDIPVQATGRECPECFDTFEELNEIEALANSKCAQQMLKNIERSGFTSPTPVQKWSLPIALGKRDLMACAQTGSGKTGGFLFPLVLRTDFLRRRRSREPNPSSLILAPTRELATQIFKEAEKFTYDTGVKVVVVYGGTNFNDQARALRRGCDILVATPGRLVHLLEHRRVVLRDCVHLVLDEADRMLDMGFEPQIRQVVDENHMPKAGERLTLMFSATFPDAIQRLAADFLDDYIFLTVGRVGSTTDNIKQCLYHVDPRDKLNKVCQLLREPHLRGLTLVFVETKRSADRLEHELYEQGYSVTSIHGDRSQTEREEALYHFKSGHCQVLVATDVASRGLDIPAVTHVINYDMPSDIDSYVHRIGRTGRAGNTGTASGFFCDKNNNIVRPLLELLKEAKQHIPDWLKERKFELSHPGERNSRRGGAQFGGRDFRQQGGRNRRGGGRGGPGGGTSTAQQKVPLTDAW